MRYIDYGNDEKLEYTNSLELFDVNDLLSARSLNRPIINSYDYQESSNFIIQILLKKLIKDGVSGIVPGAYDEFKTLSIISLSEGGKKYLKIPTGIIITDCNNGKDYAIINQPRIEFAERKFADLIDFNLNDKYNNIKIVPDGKNYFMVVTKNDLVEDKMTLTKKRIPESNPLTGDLASSLNSEDLFKEFVKTYKSEVRAKEEKYGNYNVIDRCIDLSKVNVQPGQDVMLYYKVTDDDLGNVIEYDASRKFFISINKSYSNTDAIKLFTFKLNRAENNDPVLGDIENAFNPIVIA